MKRLVLVLAAFLAACTTDGITVPARRDLPCGYGAFSVVNLTAAAADSLGYKAVCAQEVSAPNPSTMLRTELEKLTDEPLPFPDAIYVEVHPYTA